MLKLLINGVVAGFVVVAVSEVARRYPRVADVILAVPLVVFAVYAVVYTRVPELAPISRMARQMLVLVPLSLTFFVPLAFADRLHLTFWPAYVTGLAAGHGECHQLSVVHELRRACPSLRSTRSGLASRGS